MGKHYACFYSCCGLFVFVYQSSILPKHYTIKTWKRSIRLCLHIIYTFNIIIKRNYVSERWCFCLPQHELRMTVRKLFDMLKGTCGVIWPQYRTKKTSYILYTSACSSIVRYVSFSYIYGLIIHNREFLHLLWTGEQDITWKFTLNCESQ